LKESQPNALIIFTRNPELGKCKTRLAKTIGEQAALDIYLFLLAHTSNTIQKITGAHKRVYFSDRIGSDLSWDSTAFSRHLQNGSDLGMRMEHAFQETFDLGYERVLIIGSDLYDLNASDIIEAFEALKINDAVLGPASDGGYYLLGLKKIIPSLFRNKVWGTSEVLPATLENLKGYQTHLLPERNDIDRYEDIAGNPVFEDIIKKSNHD
jgi:rSAM/selenodomain-associated transferase 1